MLFVSWAYRARFFFGSRPAFLGASRAVTAFVACGAVRRAVRGPEKSAFQNAVAYRFADFGYGCADGICRHQNLDGLTEKEGRGENTDALLSARTVCRGPLCTRRRFTATAYNPHPT